MTDEFILLPREGLVARDAATANILAALPRAVSTGPSVSASLSQHGGGALEILDTAMETGPKLVRMAAEDAEVINRTSTAMRVVPVVTYTLPDVRPERMHPRIATTPAGIHPLAGTAFTVTCSEAGTNAPIAGADVIAFDNFAQLTGDQGKTDATGSVSLTIQGNTIDRLYVYTAETHWGAFRRNVPVVGGANIQLSIDPVSLTFVDAVRHYYGASRFVPATGVVVGVVDTGVGPHGDLNLLGGANTVTGEPATAIDDWYGHGTHVAGLIGSNGTPPSGLRGVSPGVGVRAYRVFGQGAEGATNYAILKALIRAALDQCDIVNLSLGGGPADTVVEEAIADARSQGMLVVVAAGNDGRKPVSYPAAYPGATAVSALGRDGTFPVGSVHDGDRQRPPNATDPAEFMASFSNVGSQIAVTAPGVGVLSTLPNNRHGPMSGTSMAAPVAAGAAASLLSQNAATFGLPRNAARSQAIQNLLYMTSAKRTFTPNGPIYEGFGLPDPAVV
jgi:subtilisin